MHNAGEPLRTDEAAFVRQHPLFAALGDDWHDVSRHLVRVPLAAHQDVVRAGDAADGVHIVVAGRLRVLAADGHVVAEIGVGEVIGEMSVLTGQRRVATVRALRDSVLAHLGQGSFDALVDRVPRLMRTLAETAARRASGLVSANARASPAARVFALFGLDDSPVVDEAIAALVSAFQKLVRACCVDGGGFRDQDDADVAGRLGALELEHEVTLLRCDPADTPWTRRALRQADRVLLVGVAGADPDPGPLESRLLDALPDVPVQLLLVQPPDIRIAEGTSRWLQPRPRIARHFHARQGSVGDFARCARLLLGRGIGHVFSGAGTRGAAHVGYYRAVRHLGIPIDVVAGSSSGAGIAAGVAAGTEPAEVLAAFLACMEAFRPTWLRLQPPVTSLMSGSDARRALLAAFGLIRLEDLLIPCILTAVDLVRGQMVELVDGPVWLGVRASSSLPVLLPPVCVGERLLVDGGVVANVPVHVLEPSCSAGRVFVSDLDPGAPFRDLEPFGDAVSGWTALREQMLGRMHYPSLVDLVITTMCLANRARHETTHRDAVFVRMPMEKTGVFAIGRDEAPALEAAGFEFACAALGPEASRLGPLNTDR